jgi:hypothetical protein
MAAAQDATKVAAASVEEYYAEDKYDDKVRGTPTLPQQPRSID